MSLSALPRNPELANDDHRHFSDDELRYVPEVLHQRFEEWPPVIIETYPDQSPKRGLCGRDNSGNVIIPAGAIRARTPLTTGNDLADEKIGSVLRSHDVHCWHMFEADAPDSTPAY
ncbi:MAG: hypothetical protein V1846_03505 [Candidatus Komeilibacteria bacterium]